jgi:hypothetical protein
MGHLSEGSYCLYLLFSPRAFELSIRFLSNFMFGT